MIVKLAQIRSFMAGDPEIYEGIDGIDSEGYLEPDASGFEVGAAIGGLRSEVFDREVASRVDAFLERHALSADELRESLIGLIDDTSRAKAEIERSIPFPSPRPVEGKLTLNDLVAEAGTAIPVDPAHKHYLQPMVHEVVTRLAEMDTDSDAYGIIFQGLNEASSLGYRARVIEER
jgi:hypothetical protein